jgi:hypothetical protein
MQIISRRAALASGSAALALCSASSAFGQAAAVPWQVLLPSVAPPPDIAPGCKALREHAALLRARAAKIKAGDKTEIAKLAQYHDDLKKHLESLKADLAKASKAIDDKQAALFRSSATLALDTAALILVCLVGAAVLPEAVLIAGSMIAISGAVSGGLDAIIQMVGEGKPSWGEALTRPALMSYSIGDAGVLAKDVNVVFGAAPWSGMGAGEIKHVARISSLTYATMAIGVAVDVVDVAGDAIDWNAAKDAFAKSEEQFKKFVEGLEQLKNTPNLMATALGIAMNHTAGAIEKFTAQNEPLCVVPFAGGGNGLP